MPISDLFTKRERGAALLEGNINFKLFLAYVCSFTPLCEKFTKRDCTKRTKWGANDKTLKH